MPLRSLPGSSGSQPITNSSDAEHQGPRHPRFQYGVMLHPTSAAAAIQSCRHGYQGCIATRHLTYQLGNFTCRGWHRTSGTSATYVHAGTGHWRTTSGRRRSAARNPSQHLPTRQQKGGQSRLSISALSSHQVSAAMPPTCRKRRPCRPDRGARPACSRYRSRRLHRYPASAWPAGRGRGRGWSAACPRAGRFRRST